MLEAKFGTDNIPYTMIGHYELTGVPTSIKHNALLWQGEASHSITSSSQFSPVYPAAQAHK